MYKQFAKQLGSNVRLYREKMGKSQEELADLADVSRAYIGMIERAERAVSLKKMYQVSRALKISFPDLFNFDNVE